MNFQSLIDDLHLILQTHHYVASALLVGLVVFLLWKPKIILKLVLFMVVFALIFYGVFYVGSYFTGGMELKKDVVHKTERELREDRLTVPSRE